MTTALNYIMPKKAITFHRNDRPWITEDLKHLIIQRQGTFSSGNFIAFKFYRNKVNKMITSCPAEFYISKLGYLIQMKPKEWWRVIKRLCGMTPASNCTSFSSQFQLENTDDLSPLDLGNLINNFLELMKDFSLLAT